MKCLIVVAHPMRESLCRMLAAKAADCLYAGGHDVVLEDLYGQAFDAALTESERATYYTGHYDAGAVQAEAGRLLAAEGLVLCFPTWWFGFPAILKGWFDRTWAPGIAYDHASNLGAIRPRLHGLRRVLVVTSLGSPWWVDRIVMGQPVKRILKTAIIGTCTSACKFEMISIYKSEHVESARAERFAARMAAALAKWC